MKVTQLPTRSTGKTGAVQIVPPAPLRKADALDIKNILAKFEKDDYILAGIILVLILEGCDDYILLAALGYLFFMGFKE